jgi:hypothetical protein
MAMICEEIDPFVKSPGNQPIGFLNFLLYHERLEDDNSPFSLFVKSALNAFPQLVDNSSEIHRSTLIMEYLLGMTIEDNWEILNGIRIPSQN